MIQWGICLICKANKKCIKEWTGSDICLTELAHIWHHDHTMYKNFFTQCLNAYLHLWRHLSHCFIYIYTLFEDIFIQCLRICLRNFYKMFKDIFIQNCWLCSHWWKLIRNSKRFKSNYEDLNESKLWEIFHTFHSISNIWTVGNFLVDIFYHLNFLEIKIIFFVVF